MWIFETPVKSRNIVNGSYRRPSIVLDASADVRLGTVLNIKGTREHVYSISSGEMKVFTTERILHPGTGQIIPTRSLEKKNKEFGYIVHTYYESKREGDSLILEQFGQEFVQVSLPRIKELEDKINSAGKE